MPILFDNYAPNINCILRNRVVMAPFTRIPSSARDAVPNGSTQHIDFFQACRHAFQAALVPVTPRGEQTSCAF